MAGRKNKHSKVSPTGVQNQIACSSDDTNCRENTKEIKNMLSNILTELKELRKQGDEFRNETKRDIEILTEEIRNIDKKLEDKCAILDNRIKIVNDQTNEKSKQLEEKIKTLLDAEERRQRREKRSNIIIKSKEFDKDMGSSMDTKVKEILKKIDSKEKYIRASYLGKDRTEKGLVRVELNRFEDKIFIMRNKNKLKGQDCFIDNDLTKIEREIQAHLRQRAREERDKGNTAQVGYQKIKINDQWENWQPASQQSIT